MLSLNPCLSQNKCKLPITLYVAVLFCVHGVPAASPQVKISEGFLKFKHAPVLLFKRHIYSLHLTLQV